MVFYYQLYIIIDMKKYLLPIAVLSFFVSIPYADACRVASSDVVADVRHTLLNDTSAIALAQPISSGASVSAKVIIGNKNSDLQLMLKVATDSCGSRMDDFSADEYIVVVYTKGDKTIEHSSLDHQFSYTYTTQSEAMDKYKELTTLWERRAIEREKSLNTETSTDSVKSNYTPTDYTLRPGMKDDFVLALQTALKAKLQLGEEFKLDGSYGPATSEAVKQFQTESNIESDGLAGKKTQAALSSVVAITNIKTETVNESQEVKTTSGETQASDVVFTENNISSELDIQIRDLFRKAKNEIINYSKGTQSFASAHSLVIKYNNQLIGVSAKSDPLYKSANGGSQFIYFGRLSDGTYICVDDNESKELTETKVAPKLDGETISC